jgi:8-hydroxy-5-deazaflavin:NADPH oxidoreductase
MKPRVGIIGKGNVGSAVKRGLERAGYKVKMVGKDPKGVSETARWADIIVLAVPFQALDETIAEMGDGLSGKTLVDATNIHTPDALASVGSKNGTEVLQSKVPGAKVVKALNMHFSKNMDTGRIGGQQLTFLVAGDDKDAKARVLELGKDLGFDPVDAGPLTNAGLLESLGNLTIQLGYPLGLGTSIGFSLVRA